MSQWLDMFREAPVTIDTPVTIATKETIAAEFGPNVTNVPIVTGIESETEAADVAHAPHLTARSPPARNATDWQALYDERAAIREIDGELPCLNAEQLAFDDCVAHWLVQHPPEPTDDTTGCVACGAALGDDGVPVLARDSHTWVHSRCHSSWLADRRQQAAETLRAMGVSA